LPAQVCGQIKAGRPKAGGQTGEVQMADKYLKNKYSNQPAARVPADEEEEELGYIELADDVIAIVASLAALDVPGVLSMSTGFREGLSNFLGKKSLAKGVRVKVTGHSCRIAVYVTVEYGCNIPEVAMKLQKKVKSAVDEMTEYTAEYVDVHIEGVRRREKSELEISFNSPEETRSGSIF
jgi:uncharacterized alkaline shock family protein YloU